MPSKRAPAKKPKFTEESLQIRRDAQAEHGAKALEALRQLALTATPDSAKVSAWREYLKQVLGRPQTTPSDTANQDGLAAFEALSVIVREKLIRITDARSALDDRNAMDAT
jgi:hypothetical protein